MAMADHKSLHARDSNTTMLLPSKLLHDVLSDVDRKVSAIRTILEGDDDFTDEKSDKIIGRRKDEILELLNELKKSCHSLAEDPDHLMTKFIHQENALGSTCSNAVGRFENPTENEKPSGSPETESPRRSAVEDPELENFDFRLPSKSMDEILFQGLLDIGGTRIDRRPAAAEIKEESEELDWGTTDSGWEEMKWDEMKVQVTALVEESMQKQEDLVRRNEEKRGIIRGLQMQVSSLKAENKALQDCLVSSKVDSKEKQFQISTRLKGLVWGKIFGRGT